MKRATITSVSMVFLIFLAGCSTQHIEPASQPFFSDPDAPAFPPTFTEFPISKVLPHNNHLDCWIIVEDEVYDVTSYIKNHPDGKAMITHCGKDVTDIFLNPNNIHPIVAHRELPQYYIGDLQ